MGGDWCYGRGLLKRVGWELWLGDRWERIVWVRIRGDVVLIETEHAVYKAGYMDAVRCRPAKPGLMCALVSEQAGRTVAPPMRSPDGTGRVQRGGRAPSRGWITAGS
jgi:hypothetical protein